MSAGWFAMGDLVQRHVVLFARQQHLVQLRERSVVLQAVAQRITACVRAAAALSVVAMR